MGRRSVPQLWMQLLPAIHVQAHIATRPFCCCKALRYPVSSCRCVQHPTPQRDQERGWTGHSRQTRQFSRYKLDTQHLCSGSGYSHATNVHSHISTRHIFRFRPVLRWASIRRSFPYPTVQPTQDLPWQGRFCQPTEHALCSMGILNRPTCFAPVPAMNVQRRISTTPSDGCPYVWYPASAGHFCSSPTLAGDTFCPVAHRGV